MAEQVSNDCWGVPWQGRVAQLCVRRSRSSTRAAIYINGSLVAEPAKPSLDDPWIETPVDQSGRVLVIQLQERRYAYATLVFVDGRSLDDGESLDVWRLRRPLPTDRFEQGFRGPLWGPIGVAVLGLALALPGLARAIQTGQPLWLGAAAFGWIVGAAVKSHDVCNSVASRLIV